MIAVPVASVAHRHGAQIRGPTRSYERRQPEGGVLFKILQEHLDTFLVEANAANCGAGGVPVFVEKELRNYLSCGVLSRGFARFKCSDCSFERLVALSCKGRGFCPRCGGRRMNSLAAQLTDHVIPFVPVRQFVLSLPYRLRYRLAYDHERCVAVLRIFIRAVMTFYRRRARKRGVCDGRTGSVTFLQRFGSAANCNLHFHAVVLDGVFSKDANGELSFCAAEPPTEAELAKLVETIRTRVLRHLAGRGDIDGDPIGDEAPALASCYAGSIAGRQSLGRRPGAKLQRIGADPGVQWARASGPLQAQAEGFDLHAARTVPAHRQDERARLEELLRYCARPPISDERLRIGADGSIFLRLKTPWKDGSTHVVYEPLDFVAKLAALVPRPHKNLVVYHGVLAANAAWRSRVVAYGRQGGTGVGGAVEEAAASNAPRSLRRQWAELMRRSFGFDVLSCADCGGKMRLLAVILDLSVIRKVLSHIGLPSEPPTPAAARAPPEPDLLFDDFA